jgi:hypothetical protein
MPRLLGASAIVVAFMATGNARTVGAAEQAQDATRAALFVTLPMTNGFADATDALVETKGVVHDALDAAPTVRLVDHLQDSEAVLTVLGRGTGYAELTTVLQGLDPSVVVSPVMLHANERYIEAMLAVGSCGDAATSATKESKSPSCYRKIFVGLDDRDVRQAAKKGAPSSWTVCANALARDVEAWVTQNATRLLALRG